MVLDFCLEFSELLFDFVDDLIDASEKIVTGIGCGKIRFVGHGHQQIDDRRIRLFQIHGDMNGNETIKNPVELIDFGTN